MTTSPPPTTPTPPRVVTSRAPTPGVEDLTPHNARTHARTREVLPPPLHRASTGPATRNESDRRNASELSELAEKLNAGMSVRLERTRPTWAAGWVEDVMIDDHDLASVIDYVNQEHGGQMYRATVIGVDGAPLYTARLPVSGPPRRQGKILPRSWWTGDDPEPRIANPIAQPQREQTAAPGFDLNAIVNLVSQITSQGRERQDTLVDSVREMNAQNQATTTKLLTALMSHREQERQGGGLRDQLRELVQAKQAFEEVQEVLGVAPPTRDQNPSGEDDMMQSVMKEAAVGIIRQGLQNDANRTQQPSAPRQPPPGFRRVEPRQQQQPQPTQPNGHAKAQP